MSNLFLMESIEEINTQIKNLDEQIGQLIAYFNSILAEFGHLIITVL
jgi:chorismate mutase